MPRTRTTSWQKRRTDCRELRSSCLTTMSPLPPISSRSSLAASSALSGSLHARMTRAWSRSSSAAVARPMPQLAPVMITVFPRIRAEAAVRALLLLMSLRATRMSPPPNATAAATISAEEPPAMMDEGRALAAMY
ncbi:hypothetical protein GDO81_029463 [Engystomops pustulosus]|uniref:Uncharacterized protein n=1 Tax=Engystomops pustulosus TaxID=76066 RepID=A0AAV6YC50_ENGPU|nr:hypothetical protein GDO81_029463 [Engystomops pustulosus]